MIEVGGKARLTREGQVLASGGVEQTGHVGVAGSPEEPRA